MYILGAHCENDLQFNGLKQIIDSSVWWLEPQFKKGYDDVRIKVLPETKTKKARIRIFGRFSLISKRVTLPLPFTAIELINSIHKCLDSKSVIIWTSDQGRKWYLDRYNNTLQGYKTLKSLSSRETTILLFLMSDVKRKFNVIKLHNVLGLSQDNKHALLVQISRLRKVLPDGLKLGSQGKGDDLHYKLFT